MKINCKINARDFERVMAKLQGQAFEQEVATWVEALGFQFLEEVQREIVRLGVVDTRRLLNSFNKGGDGNIWEIQENGLKLTVGTNVEYAAAVNDGHRQDRRWVPGYWEGERFVYEPQNQDTGMLLTATWVEGKPFWDNATIIFERIFATSMSRKFNEWANRI